MWLRCGRYDPLSWEYPSWASINGPAVNILKGALVASDRIVTVSQVCLASAWYLVCTAPQVDAVDALWTCACDASLAASRGSVPAHCMLSLPNQSEWQIQSCPLVGPGMLTCIHAACPGLLWWRCSCGQAARYYMRYELL